MQTLTLKLQTGGLRLDLAGHFVTITKKEDASASRDISGLAKIQCEARAVSS